MSRERPAWFFFDCPACTKSLRVHSAFLGSIGPCPSCRVMVQSPKLSTQQSPIGRDLTSGDTCEASPSMAERPLSLSMEPRM
ncbi:MAG: hypothetical protein ACI8T1_001148 [Verrucomicrobiales bacterium]|jgi:hypothetical protein